VADVVPPAEAARQPRRLGAKQGTMRILGDIISPAVDEQDWEVLAE
jgi:hypothetical protein